MTASPDPSPFFGAPSCSPQRSLRKRRRRNLCIVSPSRSLIYSLEFIAKVHCVPRSVYESTNLIEILGADRVLEDCGILIVEIRREGTDKTRRFLRELVFSGQTESMEIVVLSDIPQHMRYPGVTEIRTTSCDYQLNVREFEKVLLKWRHEFAQPHILPAYHQLLERAHDITYHLESNHHFWQNLALLDGDPLFNDVVRFVAMRLGFTFKPYRATMDLARDIVRGMPFAAIMVDQACEYSAADDIDPSTLLAAASAAYDERPDAAQDPAIREIAQKVRSTPEMVRRRFQKVKFYSVHDQMTRILPPIPRISEVDRMYPSNPLLVNVGNVARKLDPDVRITTKPVTKETTETVPQKFKMKL